jgi:Recombination endonuclease VII
MPYADPAKRRVFSKFRQRKYRLGHPSWRRDQHLRLTYGLTQDQWDAIFLAQGFRCAACQTLQAGRTNTGKDGCWHTDHDPLKKKGDLGFIRGILCHWCNLALHRHQTAISLRLLADYLEKHQ